MKKIGIIAYDFPPLNSGGAKRPYLMAKHLAKLGFDVIVFSLKEDHYPSDKINFNVSENVLFKIVRTDLKNDLFFKRIFDSHYFNLTDTVASRWIKYLFPTIMEENKLKEFDYLICTCPPFSLAKPVICLAKRIKVPFILDMRDAWSQWVISPYASYFHYKRLLRLERFCLENSKWILAVSKQQRKDFLRVHRNIDKDKILYVPNGFEDDEEVKENKKRRDDGKIIISYTGSFYYNPKSQQQLINPWYKKKPYQYLQFAPRLEDWKYRSPYYFFRILQRLFQEEPSCKDKLILKFAGVKTLWLEEMVKEFSLENVFYHEGFLSRDSISRLLVESDYSLITSSKVKDGRDYSLAGKTLDLFSLKVPIVAVVTEGEQKDVNTKAGLSIILNPDNVEESVQILKNALNNKTSLPKLKEDYVKNFKYPNNLKQLIKKIEDGSN